MTVDFVVDKLPGRAEFGAVVSGLRRADLAMSDVRHALTGLFIQKGIIVIRGLDGGCEAQVELSEIFGACEMHPLFKDNPGQHPTLIDLKFNADEQEHYEIDGELCGGWLPWHSDLAYVQRINRGGVLR